MKILIVEDEPKVLAFLNQGLSEQGYDTEVVYDGQMGLKMAQRHTYDLILLDIIVPYINGLELCRQIKEVQPQVPIIMLTALGTTEDKLTGFDAGADDYLVKPFEFKELLARIRALLKRSSGQVEKSNKLKAGNLELDLNKKSAFRNGLEIALTAKEFALLEYLMRHQGRVMSRAEIAEHVWEITFDTGTNVVDVYMNLLRKKIDKDFDQKLLHTKIGMGYILHAE